MSEIEPEKVEELKRQREEALRQPGGAGYGHLEIDDSKIGVIRHPDNAHLDEQKDQA